tara:strand:- start:3747 stop:4031 length:285 start_codon:yes stop_codon:yes gene_type:complete
MMAGKGEMTVDDITASDGLADYDDEMKIDIPNSTFKGKFRGKERIFGVLAMAESDIECPTCNELVKGSAIMLTDIGMITACKGCKVYTLHEEKE